MHVSDSLIQVMEFYAFFVLGCICDPPVGFGMSMYVMRFFLTFTFGLGGETLFAPRPLCSRYSAPSSMILETHSLQEKSWTVYVRF